MVCDLKRSGFHVGVFGDSINDIGLRNIESYSYKSSGTTFLDLKMNSFWELLACKIPDSISPNLLTVLGFISSFIAIMIIMFHNPMLNNTINFYVSIAVSILLFLYQTLDAVDGKHARRLKLSSPLGQLLDHGLDSYTTVFFVTIFCAACRMGWSNKYFIFLSVTQLKMLSFIWLECHCKIFRCSSTQYLGVTESQFTVILFTIFSSTDGFELLINSGILNMKYIDIIISMIIITGIITLINDFLFGLRECKSSLKLASLEVCGMLCHIMFQFLFLSSNTYSRFPILTLLIITTSSSIIALRMNVSSFTLEELPFIHWPLLPFYICSIMLLFGKVLLNEFLDLQLILLLFISVWNILYTIDFAVVTICSICRHLKISLFQTSRESIRIAKESTECRINEKSNSFVNVKQLSVSRSSKKYS
ncbi:cdp-alcohol phosphatidyltransferase superfamily protein [Cryptosporidium felis]|nr:cdp-alcohol phosphatidyltransferase superfamily protein [Cryptosporidium felis]